MTEENLKRVHTGMSWKQWALLVVSAGILVALGWAWGAIAVRDRAFPYHEVRALLGRPDSNRRDVRAQIPDLSSLKSLGYLNTSFDERSDQRGVIDHDAARAHAGINLYGSRDLTEAALIDMTGRVLHEWRGSGERTGWQHLELLPDGRLLATVKDSHIEMRDLDSSLLWRLRIRAHHDLSVADGSIWLNTRVSRVVPEVHPTEQVTDDLITEISLDGEIVSEWSVLDAMLASPYRFLLRNLAGPALEPPAEPADLLHTNHVQVIDAPGGSHAAFAPGNFLLSMRNINAIAVFDRETHAPLWLWGPGILTFQHHPTLLSNGSVLLFDNGRSRSRVIEVAPDTGAIGWIYKDPDFFSRRRGSAQRLPNGNTLITESDSGWVFEVTPKAETVWSFANPRVDAKGSRSAIWRMVRLPADFASAWASASNSQPATRSRELAR